MIERKIYTCEICKTDYENAKDCVACEANHKMKLHIKDMVFKPYKPSADGFPTKLLVAADDGSQAVYHRG